MKFSFNLASNSSHPPIAMGGPAMNERLAERRLHARKSRIRQRIDRYHYGRRPFKLTRRTAVEMATGLMLLALLGAAGLW